MAGDEAVVEKKVSWWGLFHLHVMRMGERVDCAWWIENEVQPMGGEVTAFYEYKEEELGVWHLQMWWKVEGYQARVKAVTPVRDCLAKNARNDNVKMEVSGE